MKKLTSRKFILALLTEIVSIATLFQNYDNTKVQIVAIVTCAVAGIVYGIIEGNIDAKAVAEKTLETLEKVKDIEEEK